MSCSCDRVHHRCSQPEMAATTPHISSLPEPALRAILLGFSDSLLRHAAAYARVCPEWRRVVGGSAAYGLG
eukprot:COSAG04_NODE_24795_length_316_cov_2.589862_1_plen_70_part_01